MISFFFMISKFTTFLFFYLYGMNNTQTNQDAIFPQTSDYKKNGSEIISKSSAFVQEGGFGLQPKDGSYVDENCPWLHVEHPMFNNSDINSVRKKKQHV